MLVLRGASAYPARPFVDYPRAVLGGGGTQETDFAQMSIGHAERRQLPCLGAETPARSCRRSYWVHQPWLVAPRGSLTANLVVRHSTPNSTARRPAPTNSRACARAQVGRSSCYCTGPASARRTAYRPPTGAIEVLGRLPAPSAPPSRGCGCMLPHRTCSASLCRQFAAAFGIDLDLKWP